MFFPRVDPTVLRVFPGGGDANVTQRRNMSRYAAYGLRRGIGPSMHLMDRRRFLTTTALAGAATTLPKHADAADTRTKVATLDELNPVKLAYYPDSDSNRSSSWRLSALSMAAWGLGPTSWLSRRCVRIAVVP